MSREHRSEDLRSPLEGAGLPAAWSLEAVLDAIPEGVVLYGAGGAPIRANRAARRDFGFDPTEADSRQPGGCLTMRHPDGRPVATGELPASRALAGEPGVEAVFRLVGAEGKETAVLVSASPLVVEERIVGAVGIWRDVTAQERLSREVERNAARAHMHARMATRLGGSLSAAQVLHTLCEEAATLFGAQAVSVATFDPLGSSFRLAAARGLPTERIQRLPPLPRQVFETLAGADGRVVHLPDLRRLPDALVAGYAALGVRTLLAVSLIHQGDLVGALTLYNLGAVRSFRPDEIDQLREVADLAAAALVNARLFEEVRRQRQQLRLLARWLSEAEEAERRRLARELHDQVGQNLTALGIALSVLRGSCGDAGGGDLASRLDDAMSLVKQTTATIRGLMADLRPPVLDDYGLGEALRWYAERFGIRTGIAVEVSEGGDERRLPSAVENALFRIAQEALTNVAKHAKTARATIRLDVEAQAVRLQVADEGGGFEPAITGGPDRDRGWGLVAMRERAEAVGGQCRIDSRPGGGTRVLVEVPR